jgi:hypothetical protein
MVHGRIIEKYIAKLYRYYSRGEVNLPRILMNVPFISAPKAMKRQARK